MNKEDDRRFAELSGDLKEAILRGDTRYLIEALDDASVNVRLAAVEGLSELGGEQARMALLHIARDRWGERPELRIAALRALRGPSEPSRYIELLDEFISSDNRKVVAAARSMMRDLDPDGYPARLVAHGCLDHGAIRVYGTSGEPAALPLLIGYLDRLQDSSDLATGRHWGKAYAAVRALGNIGGADSVQTLQDLLGWLDAVPEGDRPGFKGQRLDKVQQEARRALEMASREA